MHPRDLSIASSHSLRINIFLYVAPLALRSGLRQRSVIFSAGLPRPNPFSAAFLRKARIGNGRGYNCGAPSAL